MPGSGGLGVIQTMSASIRRRPRSAGVFSGLQRMASCAIRSHTWPSGSNSAPNQRVPLDSRVGSRGVRLFSPPGQSSRLPTTTIACSPPVMRLPLFTMREVYR